MNAPDNTEVASVRPGAVAATLVNELVQMFQEIAARRAFAQDVIEWLNATGFGPAFETFRAKKNEERAAARASALGLDRVAGSDDTKAVDVDR